MRGRDSCRACWSSSGNDIGFEWVVRQFLCIERTCCVRCVERCNGCAEQNARVQDYRKGQPVLTGQADHIADGDAVGAQTLGEPN